MRKPLLYTALLVTAASLACDPGVDALSPDVDAQFARSGKAPVHHVSAGGQVSYEGIFDNVPTEVYGFTASIDGNENVRGQFESHWGKDYMFHMDITCLSVEGNRAWLGGVTTRSNSDDFPVGVEWLWSVVDNGEGKNADPDQLSFFFGYSTNPEFGQYRNASDCDLHLETALFDWTSGNVQVK